MTRKVFIIVSIVLAAAFAAWFLTTHERVSETRYTGYQGEARINRFLAATMLMNEVDVAASSLDSFDPLDWMPEIGDTIFTQLSADLAVENQRAVLEDWVTSGGHLIIMPPDEPSRLVDDAFARFGFALVQVEPPDDEESDESAETDDTDEVYDYTVALGLIAHRVEVLHDVRESTTLSDDLGVIVARRAFGDGYVTVVADSILFENPHLEDFDHALLLLDIVFGYVVADNVWLVYGASFTPLWQIIWVNAPYAVIGSLALLLIAIWAAMPVFGPNIPAAPPIRRSIIEHIRAAGTFVWKQRGAGVLTDAASKAVLHRAESRHPGIGRLAPEKQAALIARITGLDPKTILNAIHGGGDPHTREFTKHMATLQKIRKEL